MSVSPSVHLAKTATRDQAAHRLGDLDSLERHPGYGVLIADLQHRRADALESALGEHSTPEERHEAAAEYRWLTDIIEWTERQRARLQQRIDDLPPEGEE